MWLPAFIHSIALILALNIQTLSSPLLGLWLILFLAGCACLLKDGYPKANLLWYACLSWLVVIFVSANITSQSPGGAAIPWVLSSMPALAMCLHKRHLPYYIIGFGAVVIIYAAGLIYQELLHVHYTNYNPDGGLGRSWPLVDSNNAALIINMALIPAFYLALRKWGWMDVGFVFLLWALVITKSRTGIICAAASCMMLMVERFGLWLVPCEIIGLIGSATAIHFLRPDWIIKAGWSIQARIPIWEASWNILMLSPWVGLGFGSFPEYYAKYRTEPWTGGFFAHNDFLQLAIEMGAPFVAVFCLLWVCVFKYTRKENIVSACVIMTAIVQGMMEFQFYLPPTALMLGLALAYHRCNWESDTL